MVTGTRLIIQFEVKLGQPHTPTHEAAAGVIRAVHPTQALMIRSDNDVFSFWRKSEFEHCQYNAKAFSFRSGIVGLGQVKGSAPLTKWLRFTLIFALQERAPQLVRACVHVEC